METLPQILAQAVRTFGDRLALRNHGDAGAPTYTYRQLGAHTAAVAQRLEGLGVTTGTPVALLCENRPEWAVAYFAIHLRGAVCVPIDARLKTAETRGILARSRARLFLVSHPLSPAADEAAHGLGNVMVAVIEALLAETDTDTSAEFPASGPRPLHAPTSPCRLLSGLHSSGGKSWGQ